MPMVIHELPDLDEARRFLLHGVWLQRVLPPLATTLRPILEWALEIVSGGQPLPVLGFVADLGHVAFGLDQEARPNREGLLVPGMPAGLARTYEDHVLGKLYADWTFERASDALRRYEGRDRARGLAFLLNQFRDRAGCDGVHLNPAAIKALLEAPADAVLAQSWEELTRGELMPLLPGLVESLITSVRRMAEMLAPEDIFELEHGTALAELGQRVALRQVLQAAERLASGLPPHRLRPAARRQEVPTRILDQDIYPVGGYAALSTRGTIESLLHSQLAYMEKEERPDLFDIKFLRDELLYYARDENQFLRRRRTFVFALWPDLVHARFKDTELPWQRGVLLLGLLIAAVRKLSDWLSTDALVFQFVFLTKDGSQPLAEERSLVETVLREQIANGTVAVLDLPAARLEEHCALLARRSLCHSLTVSTSDRPMQADDTLVTRLQIDGPRPALGSTDEAVRSVEGGDPLDSWGTALQELLQLWV